MRRRTKEWKEIEGCQLETACPPEKPFARTASENILMMQAFEWHVPDDQLHWQRLRKLLPSLKDIGVDNLWIPPGCKGMDPSATGYDIYDMYDLGEFYQKGSRATRWGPKEELQALAYAAQAIGIGIYWDTVLNHKAGADFTERFKAVKVDPRQRNIEIAPPGDIEGWVGFDFPGRRGKYSSMKYRWQHFTGVDWDDMGSEHAIYKTCGYKKGWAMDVSDESGNYDYLMFANLDHSHPEVQDDIFKWAEWIGTEIPISGMRIDAAKHYSAAFQKKFIDHLRANVGADYDLVGEYWRGEVGLLLEHLTLMDHQISLFDVPLVGRFSVISNAKSADLRQIFKGTLVEQRPRHAVTFVGNHDTQPGQSLETPIAPFFKPLAYALILLRWQGRPCIFYGDLYGIRGGPKPRLGPSCGGKLPILTRARKLYAYGDQRDYFDKRHCIGFVRYGDLHHPFGLACILSDAAASQKRMYIGRGHAGEEWTDILQSRTGTVVIDDRGYGIFSVASKSVSVWVNSRAEGRQNIARHL
ncbi:hypothetical protein N7474_006096 [Penicillium riverlandense]|uniref:uncharacterized protein n=1 Tax=Penicillium riverlandense TaxID=1903569 RepID=UPI002546961A|nr:uncharacterized protein N7474_006096 [Penicillium riverlandense]KAJ5820505.1 hypothetical protein N7474_006096 [Penicillium riverlandense]